MTSAIVWIEWLNHSKSWKELIPTWTKNLSSHTLCLLSISTYFHRIEGPTFEASCIFLLLHLHQMVNYHHHSNCWWLCQTNFQFWFQENMFKFRKFFLLYIDLFQQMLLSWLLFLSVSLIATYNGRKWILWFIFPTNFPLHSPRYYMLLSLFFAPSVCWSNWQSAEN